MNLSVEKLKDFNAKGEEELIKMPNFEYNVDIDLGEDQRDECIRKFDFLIRSGKEVNNEHDKSIININSHNFIEKDPNNICKKFINFDWPDKKQDTTQIVSDLSVNVSLNYSQSLKGKIVIKEISWHNIFILLFFRKYLYKYSNKIQIKFQSKST